jgi:hypothetical protein
MLRELSTKSLGLLARTADVPATRVDRVRLYIIERILHHKRIPQEDFSTGRYPAGPCGVYC